MAPGGVTWGLPGGSRARPARAAPAKRGSSPAPSPAANQEPLPVRAVPAVASRSRPLRHQPISARPPLPGPAPNPKIAAFLPNFLGAVFIFPRGPQGAGPRGWLLPPGGVFGVPGGVFGAPVDALCPPPPPRWFGVPPPFLGIFSPGFGLIFDLFGAPFGPCFVSFLGLS